MWEERIGKKQPANVLKTSRNRPHYNYPMKARRLSLVVESRYMSICHSESLYKTAYSFISINNKDVLKHESCFI